MEAALEATRPTWIVPDDIAFVEKACQGTLVSIEGGRELSQSNVAIGKRSEGLSHVFFKKSCVALLQIKSPRNPELKWRVTQSSFVNEHRFLEDAATWTALRAKGVYIPRTLAVSRSGDSSDFATVFRTLTEYLDFESDHIERRTMDADTETPQLLRWLARFHAHFSGESNAAFRRLYLEHGGWWRKRLRPTVKWDQLQPTVQRLKEAFPREFDIIDWVSAEVQLNDIAMLAKSDSFLASMGPSTTLIHGDVKTCNFFLNRQTPGVTAIDFQWVGCAASGLGDIVYFFYGGVTTFREDPSEEPPQTFFIRMRQIEAKILHIYCEEYNRAIECGASPLSAADASYQYDMELLEYFSTAVPYLLSDLTPKLARKNLRKYGYLTYEFDPRMTAFFVLRALEAYSVRRDSCDCNLEQARTSFVNGSSLNGTRETSFRRF